MQLHLEFSVKLRNYIIIHIIYIYIQCYNFSICFNFQILQLRYLLIYIFNNCVTISEKRIPTTYLNLFNRVIKQIVRRGRREGARIVVGGFSARKSAGFPKSRYRTRRLHMSCVPGSVYIHMCAASSPVYDTRPCNRGRSSSSTS